MTLLWESPGQTVSEVEATLNSRRAIAHTTVLTTLDRMHSKGFLTRSKEGKAFRYFPSASREEFHLRLAREVISGLLNHFREPAISAFVELMEAGNDDLDRLEAMIQRHREKQAE